MVFAHWERDTPLTGVLSGSGVAQPLLEVFPPFETSRSAVLETLNGV